MTRIFFLAGESSGDLYAGLIAQALHNQEGTVAMTGVGGREMSAAGISLVQDYAGLDVLGFWEGVRSAGLMRDFIERMRRHLVTQRPDVFVPLGLPGVNLSLCRTANRLGIPVVYLMPPQIWAWGSWRARILAASVNRVVCFLPFELPFLRARGVNAVYLGNPLCDVLAPYRRTQEKEAAYSVQQTGPDKRGHPSEGCPLLSCRCATAGASKVVLMPGSRRSEIQRHLPLLTEVARQLDEMNVVKTEILTSLTTEPGSHRIPPLDVRYRTMASADLIIAASGTATLEAAILRVPLIVFYRLSGISHLLARLLVRLDYFSLPNLILINHQDTKTPRTRNQEPGTRKPQAGPVLIPEFLQPHSDELYRAARELLLDETKRNALRETAALVGLRLGESGAAARIAEELLRFTR
jgi:lipid-A-disaccharide synthase